MNLLSVILVYLFVFINIGTAFECYGDGMNPQYCSAASQFCLKAVAYNGEVYRTCAYVQDCPQGPSCAPITYGDGNTDYVCCCVGELCNSASLPSMFAVIIPVILYVLNKVF